MLGLPCVLKLHAACGTALLRAAEESATTYGAAQHMQLCSRARLPHRLSVACRGELTAGSRLPEALQGHLHTHAAFTLAACRVRSPALLMDHRWLPRALGLGPQLAAHTVEPGASSRGPGHLVRLLPLHLTSVLALQ